MKAKHNLSPPAAESRSTPNRRKLFLTSAVAGSVALAIAGGYAATTTNAVATAAAVQVEPGTGFSAPPSFADVAAQVTPAVVNVAVIHDEGGTMAHPRIEMPGMPEGTPFREFFHRFFEEGRGIPKGFEMPQQSRAQGSGFIVDPDGYIVTNDHVVDGASEIQVILNDGSRYRAEIQGRDSKTDLALLKIDAPDPLPYVDFGNSESARIGDWVLAVGNPFGLGGSVSAGIISALGRDIHSGPYDDYLQIDAPINRGNSGGPLFDARGQVIGVNTAIYSPSGGNVGIGFAIPASTADSVIRQLRADGRIERGWLGIQIQSVTEDIAESLGLASQDGALVADIFADSPAARSDLRTGDVILSMDGLTIDDVKTLTRLVADTKAGSKVSLEVRRGNGTEKVAVVVGQMPEQDPTTVARHTETNPSPPRLGLRVAPLTPEARSANGLDAQAQGVLVVEVDAGSPAERAGIKPGSVISMVGQQQVKGPRELIAEVRAAVESDRPTVLLLIQQNGEKHFVPVQLRA